MKGRGEGRGVVNGRYEGEDWRENHRESSPEEGERVCGWGKRAV